MQDLIMARIMFTATLTTLESLMMHLTEDELDALIDELNDVYEKYNNMVDARADDKQ
jgi:hypothetical protein